MSPVLPLPVVSSPVVSGVTTEEVSSVDGVVVVVVVSAVVPSSVALSLQATNAPIAKINKSFFIVLNFVLFMNDYMLILSIGKGNLSG